MKRKKKLHRLIKTVECWFCDGTYFVSVVLTDVRSALIGVGLIVKDDKSGLSILDRGNVKIITEIFKVFFQKQL